MYKVVFFCSRNKDNKNIEGFKERRWAKFVNLIYDKESIEKYFDYFVKQGKPGELSRMYISVNERDKEQVKKELMHKLIDDHVSVANIEPTIASIAASKECAAGEKWLFDFDCADNNKLMEFIKDINYINPLLYIEYGPTIHGYYVITSNGFDTRKLMEKWGHLVENKKDGSRLVKWKINK